MSGFPCVKALIAGTVACVVFGQSASAAAPTPDLAGYRGTVQPTIEKYCTGCHGAKKQKADLALHTIDPDMTTGKSAEIWQAVLDTLNLGEMPPENEPRPAESELLPTIDWITRELDKARRIAVRKGGGQLLRRLNRAEYRATIRDLIGLPIDAAEGFTTDTATHGFDNVAAGLTVSPLHVENYIAAAERVLDLALVDGERPPKIHYRIEYLGPPAEPLAADPRGSSKGDITGGNRETAFTPRIAPGRFEGKDAVFNYRGKAAYKELETVGAPPALHHDVVDLTGAADERFQRFGDVLFGGETAWKADEAGASTVKFRQFNYDPGVYRVRLKVRGFIPESWSGPLPSLSVRLEPEKNLVRLVELGTEPRTIEFTCYRESIPAYRERYGQRSWGLTLQFPSYSMVPAGEALAIPGLYYEEGGKLYRTKDKDEAKRKSIGVRDGLVRAPIGVHIESLEVEGPYLETWPPEYHDRILFASSRRADEPAYAREVLARFMERAYRRPVPGAEVERMARLFDRRRAAGESFLNAVKAPLAAVLASPRFLYLIEPNASAEGPRRLDDYELASRLSYFLWSTMPDAELLELAARGELHGADALRAQAARMLDDARAQAFVENFTGQWLRLRKLAEFRPDATLYPAFNDGLRAAMTGETTSFFSELLSRNGSVLDFLRSDWTMLNQTMASHYGVPGVRGAQFRRVAIPAGVPRGGLLTQASVLTVTSNGIRTLPVDRGVFVLEELWADPPPPAPPNAGQLEETAPESANLNVRERLDAHRRNTACAACHAKIDPLGFAMESYDAIGQWRTHERLLVDEERERKGQIEIRQRVIQGDRVETDAQLPDGRKFADITAFQRLLLEDRDRFVDCLAEKLLTYALGRAVTFVDRPLVARLREQCERDNFRIRSLIEGIVLSDAFQTK